jgi:hypothetical protein
MEGLREEILAMPVERERVHIPEWPEGEYYVRLMSLDEGMDYMEKAGDDETLDLATAMAMLIVRTLIDGDGARVFHDGDEAQVKRLPSKITTRIFKAAKALNQVGDTEKLEGN